MNDSTSAISKCGVHVLCAEILSEIFLIASHSYLPGRWEDDNTIFLKPLLDEEPCTLTRVCKEWRKVALSTPQLWSHIVVNIGYPQPGPRSLRPCTKEPVKAQREEHYAKQLDMVVIWLRLSRNTPLMLCFCIYGNKPLPSELVETFGRWSILHVVRAQRWVYKTETVISPILRDLLPGNANTLQRLMLQMKNPSQLSKSELHLKHCPHLKHLSTTGVTVISIQSHHLESLRGSWSVAALLRYLQDFQHLKILHVEIPFKGSGLDDPVTSQLETLRVTSQLETLKITGELDLMSAFFSRVNLPALRSADIILNPHSGNIDHENQYYENAIEGTIPTFFLENSPNLTKLILDARLIDGAEACKYLRATPLVVELSLHVKTLEVAEVRSIIGGEKGEICPKLNFLKLYVHKPYKVSADILIQALQSRFSKNKSMTIYIEFRCDPSIIEQLTADARLKKLKENHALTLELQGIVYGSESDSEDDSCDSHDSYDWYGYAPL